MAAGELCQDCPSYDIAKQTCQERQRCFKLGRQYTEELQQARIQPCPHLRSKGKLTLLEVFCGPQSQLTHQVQQLGFKAERLGFSQCDLQQYEGRKMLFQTVAARNPEHLWVFSVLWTLVWMVHP